MSSARAELATNRRLAASVGRIARGPLVKLPQWPTLSWGLLGRIARALIVCKALKCNGGSALDWLGRPKPSSTALGLRAAGTQDPPPPPRAAPPPCTVQTRPPSGLRSRRDSLIELVAGAAAAEPSRQVSFPPAAFSLFAGLLARAIRARCLQCRVSPDSAPPLPALCVVGISCGRAAAAAAAARQRLRLQQKQRRQCDGERQCDDRHCKHTHRGELKKNGASEKTSARQANVTTHKTILLLLLLYYYCRIHKATNPTHTHTHNSLHPCPSLSIYYNLSQWNRLRTMCARRTSS